jgi:hypothetical protein
MVGFEGELGPVAAGNLGDGERGTPVVSQVERRGASYSAVKRSLLARRTDQKNDNTIAWPRNDCSTEQRSRNQPDEDFHDPVKPQMAWQLRQETTMTLKWIAQRLEMGRWTYLSNCLIKMRKTKGVKMHDPCSTPAMASLGREQAGQAPFCKLNLLWPYHTS